MSPNHLAPKPRKSSGTVVETFYEPRSAAVPAASCGGVSPPARTPGGTPGALAGEDACATSAGQFMVPMHAKKRKGALHEPSGHRIAACLGKAALKTHAIQVLTRRPLTRREREAFGVRPIYRRFTSDAGETAVHGPNSGIRNRRGFP